MFKGHLVVRIKHDELELYVVCNVRDPLPVLLFVNINIVLNINLTFVVLRVVESVWLVASFVMSNIFSSDNSTFLKVPLDHFCAKYEVW